MLAKLPEVRHLKIEDGKGRPLGRSFQVKLWQTLVLMRDGKIIKQVARPSPKEVQKGLEAVRAAGG